MSLKELANYLAGLPEEEPAVAPAAVDQVFVEYDDRTGDDPGPKDVKDGPGRFVEHAIGVGEAIRAGMLGGEAGQGLIEPAGGQAAEAVESMHLLTGQGGDEREGGSEQDTELQHQTGKPGLVEGIFQ